MSVTCHKKKRMRSIIFLIILLMGLCSFSQTAFPVGPIPDQLKNGANLVVREELINIDVTKQNKLIYNLYQVVTVLNKRGNEQLHLYAQYDDNQKINKLEATFYNIFGKEIDHYKKREFNDMAMADGFSLYNDSRMLYLDYVPTTYPFTVVFTYETESGNTAFIPAWFPLKGYATATQNSVYKLRFDPENKPRFNTKNLENYSISVEENPTEFILTATDLESIAYETFSPSFLDMAPNVKFSLNKFSLEGVAGKAENWSEFGKWMNENLLSGVEELPESTIAAVKNLVKNETTNLGKARKIYSFVQDKVRYISIQIGIGGWKPMPASKVDELGYGDCKALTNYTKALLNSVDVPTYYTILYAGDEERNISENFSSLEGNHAILGIPDNENIIWLECTSQKLPFGFGGNFSDDRDVLIVAPEGGKIIHTKKYGFQENLQSNHASVELTANGKVNAIFESSSKGLQYDDKYYLASKNNKELERHYRNKWSYLNGIIIDEIELNNNKEEIVFDEKLKLKTPNYCSAVGTDLLFCANIFNRFQNVPTRYDERKNALQIKTGFTNIDSLRISLPIGFVAESLPQEKTIEVPFGSYSVNYKRNPDNSIEYVRRFIIKKGIFPSDQYEEFRSFLQTVARNDKAKILLKKN